MNCDRQTHTGQDAEGSQTSQTTKQNTYREVDWAYPMCSKKYSEPPPVMVGSECPSGKVSMQLVQSAFAKARELSVFLLFGKLLWTNA